MAQQLGFEQLLSQQETVIFVGAGISAWSGLPSWQRMIEELVAFAEARTGTIQETARKRIAENNLVGAADRIMSRLQPTEFATFLRDTLKFSIAKPHKIHQLIASLGPTCFITTNYDNLIEQQLSQDGWAQVRVVTNRQLADMADIYRADARRFVFKPHGDLNDASSLILTDEQFADIILGNHRSGFRSVYKTLEILLATRPILFLGYSIKDLDLQLILKGLQNAFDQTAGNYWAILPDIDQEDQDELWQKYKIRTVAYSTTNSESPHAALLEILSRAASTKPSMCIASQRDDFLSEAATYSIARYGSRLDRLKVGDSFPLKVSLDEWHRIPHAFGKARRFNNSDVGDLLRQYRHSFVLQGPAGSGKSFSIRNIIAEHGREIRDWALNAPKDTPLPEIPLLLDARLYSGSFAALAATQTELNPDMFSNFPVFVIVDSLDEMAASYLENGNWLSDLKSFTARFVNCRFAYCSRRRDLVPEREIPTFMVGELSEDLVERELIKKGVSRKSLAPDTFRILRNPFVLGLLRDPNIPIFDNAKATSLFGSFIRNAIDRAGLQHYRAVVHTAIQRIAFEANQNGRDTISYERIEAVFDELKIGHSFDSRITDLLIAAGLFVSEIDGQVRFTHRSLLEYLAGCTVATLFESDNSLFERLLVSNRWDNVLAWASELLEPEEYAQAISAICRFDITLAFRLANSSEFNTAGAVEQVLRYACEKLASLRPGEVDNLAFEFEETTFAKSCAPYLKELAAIEDIIGGAAAAAAIPFTSSAEKKRWIDQICAGAVDYNKANHLAPTLGSSFNPTLLSYFLNKLEGAQIPTTTKKIDGEDNHHAVVFWHGIEGVVSGLKRAHLNETLRWVIDKSATLKTIVAEAVYDGSFVEGHRFLIDQWEAGMPNIDTYMYLWLAYKADESKAGTIFSFSQTRLQAHVKWLTGEFGSSDLRWSVELLKCCCEKMDDWQEGVEQAIKREKNQFLREVFQLALPETHKLAARSLLGSVRKRKTRTPERRCSLFAALNASDYGENFKMILPLIQRREPEVLNHLLHTLDFSDEVLPQPFSQVDAHALVQEIIYWSNHESYSNEFIAMRMAGLLTRNSDAQTRNSLIARANAPADDARNAILDFILPAMPSNMLSADDFTEETVHYLVLRCASNGFGWETIEFLSSICSERLVENILIPMRSEFSEDPDVMSTISSILEQVGTLHGRRYNIQRVD